MCLKKLENAAVGLATLALVLFVANALMINSGQNKQQEIAMRGQMINDGVKMAQLNNELVRALGGAVIQKKDMKIRDMLSEHGITVQEKPAAATPAAK